MNTLTIAFLVGLGAMLFVVICACILAGRGSREEEARQMQNTPDIYAGDNDPFGVNARRRADD